MFTLGACYVFIYVCIFLSLLVLSFLQLPVSMLTQMSTTTFFIILQKYSNIKNLFFFYIFLLTGLPPVGLFFIKFNILTYVLYQTHLGVAIILFFVFFFNMLFYAQLFNIKNYKKQVYEHVDTTVFLQWKNNKSLQSNFTSYTHYKIIFFLLSVILFFLLFIFFCSDLLFIFSL
jgi:hypothetical protein